MQQIIETVNFSATVRAQRTWAFQRGLPFISCDIQTKDYNVDCSCLNNEPFFHPVKETDLWDIQTMLTDDFNSDTNITHGWNDLTGDYIYELQFVNCSGSVLKGDINLYVNDYLVGYTGETYFQMARINFSKFWVSLEYIFCIRIEIKEPGTENHVGYINFPPMVKDPCSDGQTVEMFSQLDSFDCNGRFYQEALFYKGSNNFAFNNFRRIYGSLEKSSFDIVTEETDTGIILGKDIDEIARFRTRGTPEYVVEEIVSIFGGTSVTVQNTEWDILPVIEKNNDESQMWYIDSTLQKRLCSFGKECD